MGLGGLGLAHGSREWMQQNLAMRYENLEKPPEDSH